MTYSSHRRHERRPVRLIAAGALVALSCGSLALPAGVSPALAAPETTETAGTEQIVDAAARAAAVAAAPYTQSFESATAVDQAPAGWSVESSDTRDMREGWKGWSFHTTKDVTTVWGADGDRGSFGKSSGIVAVLASDKNRPASGPFTPVDSTLWAPAYEVSQGTEAVTVKFDSHYKQGQAPQEAKLVAKIDGAAPVLVEQFSSNRLNQAASHSLDLPAGAKSVQFGWSFLKANNNWFWMIDNVEIAESVRADVTPTVISAAKPVLAPGETTTVRLGGLRAGQQVEAVLGSGSAARAVAGIPVAAADGTVAFDVAAAAEQPQATLPLTISGAGVSPITLTVTVLQKFVGETHTTEPQLWWDGFDGTAAAWQADGAWEFMSRADVVAKYGLDRRHTFTRASGTVAIAETAAGAFDGTLTSAAVEVTPGDDLELRFDSHFRVRGSGAHTGTVALVFDTGEKVELRTLTETEESAQPRLAFTVPDGAKTARVLFDYAAPAAAGSWMIDDVKLVQPLAPLAAGTEPSAIVDVFSDVQGANAKLQNQVLPGFRNLPGGRADTVISNGDLTSNGTPAQYDAYFNAFNAGGGGDYGTRISTIGNHEFYGSDGAKAYIQRFLDRTGMRDLGVAGSESPNKGLWGETVVDGKLPVIWIGSERHEYHGGSGPFVEIWDEQYNWLRDRLDHYRDTNTPVLLSVHHIFENSVSGSYANLYKREFGDDQERMEQLIAAHPNVTLMSSHTHWNPKLNDWSVEQRFDPEAEAAPTFINTAAVTTQYGPSGDWGEVGVGGADPAGLRVALYEDRLRATVYGFDAAAQPTEIKSVDVALPTEAPEQPGNPGDGGGNGADGGTGGSGGGTAGSDGADGSTGGSDGSAGTGGGTGGSSDGSTGTGGTESNGAEGSGSGINSAAGEQPEASGGLAETGSPMPVIGAAVGAALLAAGAMLLRGRRSGRRGLPRG